LDMVLGGIVRSKAGRDKGRKFIVVEIQDALYVLISDGRLRKIEKPKKKKKKHVEFTGVVARPLEIKLANMERVTNAEIRKTLAMYEEETDKHA
jgi:large subunit ribosomal protein L14e